MILGITPTRLLLSCAVRVLKERSRLFRVVISWLQIRVRQIQIGSTCTACDVGTSSNQSGTDMAATTCVACSPGSYPCFSSLRAYPMISYAPVVGLYTCLPCETGRFASLYHSSSCSSCLEGSANPLTGQGFVFTVNRHNKFSLVSLVCELPSWLLCRNERCLLLCRR